MKAETWPNLELCLSRKPHREPHWPCNWQVSQVQCPIVKWDIRCSRQKDSSSSDTVHPVMIIYDHIMASFLIVWVWVTIYSVTYFVVIAVVQSLSSIQLSVTWLTAAHQASLSFTVCWSLLRFMSIELVMLSNHLILGHPLLLCLQSFPASGSFPMSWLFTSGGQSLQRPTRTSRTNTKKWHPFHHRGLECQSRRLFTYSINNHWSYTYFMAHSPLDTGIQREVTVLSSWSSNSEWRFDIDTLIR